MGSRPVVTLYQLRREALCQLEAAYAVSEAKALVRALLSHFLPTWRELWLSSRGEAPFPEHLYPLWQEAINRLLRYEPLAYITGKVAFGEMELKVAPGVFIPRPETEEWAYALSDTLKKTPPQLILDVGTGSGALAIFFARTFPQAQVFAVEKSRLALQIAAENIIRSGMSVRIYRHAFGEEPLPADFPNEWDLIVSNPPYIPWDRYSETDLNVRLYEPPEALFCRSWELYQHLATYAREHLRINGILAVELFPPAAEEIASLWRKEGFSVILHSDSRGQWRWIEGKLK